MSHSADILRTRWLIARVGARVKPFGADGNVCRCDDDSLRMSESTRFLYGDPERRAAGALIATKSWQDCCALAKAAGASSKLDSIVNAIEKYVQESSERERPTSKIGEMIMRRLKEMDKVAYVRFASVYLEFEDVSEFMTELKHLVQRRAGTTGTRKS